MKNKNMIILSGPTATGKTDTAIKLHHFLKEKLSQESVIINFDSLLFYKQLNIGTAKPTKQELDEAPHEMINIRDLSSPLDAFEYSTIATQKVNLLIQKKIIPVLVGGSGFYLRALIKGMYSSEDIDGSIKEMSKRLFQEKGILPFRTFLKEFDPESYNNIHPNDHYRTIRAYEFFKQNKKPISEEKKKIEQKGPYNFERPAQESWSPLHFYLNIPKKDHYPIIEQRTKSMIEKGLINEVESILSGGYKGDEKPLQSIGYKEVLSYLKGEILNTKALEERIFISTRQLAKAQRTFFNKIHPKYEINPLLKRDELNSKVVQHFKKYKA